MVLCIIMPRESLQVKEVGRYVRRFCAIKRFTGEKEICCRLWHGGWRRRNHTALKKDSLQNRSGDNKRRRPEPSPISLAIRTLAPTTAVSAALKSCCSILLKAMGRANRIRRPVREPWSISMDFVRESVVMGNSLLLFSMDLFL